MEEIVIISSSDEKTNDKGLQTQPLKKKVSYF